MVQNIQVLIIGGGLAGLTSAIHLAQHNINVLLIEKSSFPRHKVCGEYVSNEILPYLKRIGVTLESNTPKQITDFLFSTRKGRKLTSRLPIGGIGISRYELDLVLYHCALKNGVTIVKDTVKTVEHEHDFFEVNTEGNGKFTAKIVIGAFGKRSNLDRELSRTFIKKKSPWLAVKCHYKGEFPDHLVGLFNFKGGYCGVSKVENNHVNVCYLADYKTFKKHKNINEYQNKVLSENPDLKRMFNDFKSVFDKPLTISQIAFDTKPAVENHILMVGDTAGLIHPLCGNGMAMAIHSAKICSDLIIRYLSGDIKNRNEMERLYQKEWNINFKSRVKMGRFLAFLFRYEYMAKFIFNGLVTFPKLIPFIIKKTHGKPIV